MNAEVQQIIVFLIGIGCIVLIGMKIYRTFNSVSKHKNPCDGCPTECDLQLALKRKQRECEKSEKRITKHKKSCCG